MSTAAGAPSLPDLVEAAGAKAHLDRERALGQIEALLDAAGAQQGAAGTCGSSVTIFRLPPLAATPAGPGPLLPRASPVPQTPQAHLPRRAQLPQTAPLRVLSPMS